MADKSNKTSTGEGPIQSKNPHLFEIARSEGEFAQGVFDVFITFSAIEERSRFKAFMEKVERVVILRTLLMFNGNQKDAAKFLGINYTTLNEKVKRYQIHFRKVPRDSESAS